MATRLRFRVHTASSSFQFDADGALNSIRDLERVYKEAADPLELEQIRRGWDLVGTVVTPDASVASGWVRFREVMDVFETRGAGSPTKVVLARVDEDGTETAELTLGPPDWDQLRVDELEVNPSDTDNPAASLLTEFSMRVRFSARRVLPDQALVDVVGLEQTIEVTHENGLKIITQTTQLSTTEGVDAVAKGQTIGLIPISTYGTTFTYLTNGDEGVDWKILDPDTTKVPARTPSRVEIVCQIRQWGVEVGTTGPGTSPDAVSLLRRTEEKADETIRVVRASARGPGAQAWGLGKAPTDAETKTVEYDEATREFVAEWTTKTKGSQVETLTQAVVKLSGGYQAFDYEPTSGGLEPVRFDGGFLPWQAVVTIKVTRRGGTGGLDELQLPALLPAPWSLDRSSGASEEGGPYQEEPKAKKEEAKWIREAQLTYRSATAPKQHPVTELLAGAARSVNSYWL